MSTLLFLLTCLSIFILIILLVVRIARRKPLTRALKLIGIILIAYGGIWIFFYLTRRRIPTPMGTDVCFDDWCATVIAATKQPAGDSTHIFLQLQMSNHARGISQSPSEPRVHIIDTTGKRWAYSAIGQLKYEEQHGVQPGIGHRLELRESLQTVLVFTLPNSASGLKVLIEEGPWITSLLFPEDQPIFIV